MNTREQHLRERDVRRNVPTIDPESFMQAYINSNFPQTASLPSRMQEQGLVPVNNQQDALKLQKKPLSGTQFDNPGGY